MGYYLIQNCKFSVFTEIQVALLQHADLLFSVNYAEMGLIHKKILLHSTLRKMVCQHSDREIVEEIHILIVTSSSQEVLFSSAATKAGAAPCACLDVGHFVGRGGLAWEGQCLSVPVSFGFQHRSCRSITFLPTGKSARRNLLTRTNLPHGRVNRKGWESSWLKDMLVHIKTFVNCKYIVPLCCQLQLWLTWNVSWLQIEFRC